MRSETGTDVNFKKTATALAAWPAHTWNANGTPPAAGLVSQFAAFQVRTDGSWGGANLLSTASSDPDGSSTNSPGGQFVGDYATAVASKSTGWFAWTDTRNETASATQTFSSAQQRSKNRIGERRPHPDGAAFPFVRLDQPRTRSVTPQACSRELIASRAIAPRLRQARDSTDGWARAAINAGAQFAIGFQLGVAASIQPAGGFEHAVLEVEGQERCRVEASSDHDLIPGLREADIFQLVLGLVGPEAVDVVVGSVTTERRPRCGSALLLGVVVVLHAEPPSCPGTRAHSHPCRLEYDL